ncbi:hypothetical protein [Micromonospora chalcea]|uniref:hypothetical protein n=1 Tax=Micromonospora chalcea TaxID=1874 RepID=UPI003D7236FC
MSSTAAPQGAGEGLPSVGPCCQDAADSDGHTHTERCLYALGVRHGRRAVTAERDKLVEAIAYLVSLPPEAVAKAYDVTYTGKE